MISASELKNADADTIAGKEVVGIRPPVTSVKLFSNYVQGIANVSKRPLSTVITRIKLVPDAKTQFKMTFELVGDIQDSDLCVALMNMADQQVELALESAAQGHGEEEEDVKKSSKF